MGTMRRLDKTSLSQTCWWRVINVWLSENHEWRWSTLIEPESFPLRWEPWRGRHQTGAEIQWTAPLPEPSEAARGGEFEQDYGFLLSGLSESNYLAEAIIPAPQSVWGGIFAKHQILTKMSEDSPSLTECICNFINIYWFWVNWSEENDAATVNTKLLIIIGVVFFCLFVFKEPVCQL